MGTQRKWTDDDIIAAVCNNNTMSGVLKELGIRRGKKRCRNSD
jgi:hypothetical protein